MQRIELGSDPKPHLIGRTKMHSIKSIRKRVIDSGFGKNFYVFSFTLFVFFQLFSLQAVAGPYSAGDDTTSTIDPAIYCDNTALIAWATGWENYYPSDHQIGYANPNLALGPATTSCEDVVSLGDLTQDMIDAGDPVGEITMTFDIVIYNGPGFDFAVFENGFGFIFAELAYVEVSSNGEDFARFENSVFTAATEPIWSCGSEYATDVYYLAGKHMVGYGTQFDLEEITDNTKVIEGLVDLNNINYVKIVDIPGSGNWSDSLGHPIFDPWVTGGFDLNGIGIINQRDPDPSPTPHITPTASPTTTATSSPIPSPTPGVCMVDSGDFDGDGISDIAIFRPATGLWSVQGLGRIYFGAEGDIPVSGDYDGDGIANPGVFRPSIGMWAVKDTTRVYFGNVGDMPVPGDYDGDGSCDIALFENDTGLWKVRGITSLYFGTREDLPGPDDYDGDGSTDFAIFRPSSGLWAVREVTRQYFGRSGDIPVPGSYRWYGSSGGAVSFRSQIAVFRPSIGLWAVEGFTRFYFGADGDTPVIGNFNGGGLDDTGVFRPINGLWAIRELSRCYYGTTGDIPVTR